MKKEYLFAGAAIFCWGSTAAVTKLLLGSISSMQILFYSSVLAALTMLLYNALSGRLPALKRCRAADLLRLAGIGLVGLFVYNFLLYTAIDRMLAQDAFILNYLWPIMTVVFSCLILKEKMTGRTAAALGLSFAGVALVLTKGSFSTLAAADGIGVACALAASVCYGLFSALNKRENGDPFVNMMIYYAASAVVSGLFLTFRGELRMPAPAQWPGILWFGVFVHALGYSSWAYALKLGSTARVSNLAFITPFLSLVYTFVLLREPISLYSVAGLAVIVFGVLFQMKRPAGADSAAQGI